MHENGSDPNAVPVLPTLKDLQTRFLYPFLFHRERFKEAVDSLRSASLGPSPHLWEAARPPDAYVEELLEDVASWLIPSGEPTAGYLRIPRQVSSTWFAGTTAGDELGPVKQVAGADVEVFVTEQGVGLLSMPLTPGADSLDWRACLKFNYLLSHARHGVATEIRIPHPADDQKKWAQMLVSAREGIKPAPARFDPLEERLGVPGGTFTLAELMARLLRPLEALGLHPAIRGLAVYSVAHFAGQTDLERRSLKVPLAAFLAALAHVDDPMSAALSEEPVRGVNAFLAPRHWIASGLEGAAHLIADPYCDQSTQPADAGPLVARARDAYFVPYWIALHQRCVLQRAASEAARILVSGSDDSAVPLEALRADMHRFGVKGHLSQVSPRPALQRFYRLCVEGVDALAAWHELRQQISEMDSRQAARRQAQIAADLGRGLGSLANLQRTAKWILVLLVSLYCAALYHMAAVRNESIAKAFEWFGMQWGEIVFGALGLALAFFVLRPRRSRRPS